MIPAFADYEFSPWTVADSKRVVATDTEWDRVCTLPPGRIHVPVDVFEAWTGPMFEKDGENWWIGKSIQRIGGMDDARRQLFSLIDITPDMTWLVSTEHTAYVAQMTPERSPRRQSPAGVRDTFRPNLWRGARITDQRTADERIPHLLWVPAAVRWLDITPTSDIDLSQYLWAMDGKRRHGRLNVLQWAVVRNGDPVHLRSLRDQCQHAGVPFWCEPAIDGKVYRELPTVEATP